LARFFGMTLTHSDINMLQLSLMFARLAEGHVQTVNYEVNGHTDDKGYYLADGIYTPYTTFVKTIPYPTTYKRAYFSQCQEACGECVFGVLHQKYKHLQDEPNRL
jgi:hypothetical protein